jgi:hypothetical protein
MSDSPDLAGPYDPERGVCSEGHPVNEYGQCQVLNEQGACPPVSPEPEPDEPS